MTSTPLAALGSPNLAALPVEGEGRYQIGEAVGEGGMGLGLSIAMVIAKMHGGEIEVESQEGVGTIFRIVLPLADPQAS